MDLKEEWQLFGESAIAFSLIQLTNWNWRFIDLDIGLFEIRQFNETLWIWIAPDTILRVALVQVSNISLLVATPITQRNEIRS